MTTRGTRWSKVVAVFLCLVAVWGVAAFTTTRDGVRALRVTIVGDRVGQPIGTLVDALQMERRTTMVYLGTDRSAAARGPLIDARVHTDAAVNDFRRRSAGTMVSWLRSNGLTGRITELLAQLDGLTMVRAAVDAGRLDRAQANSAFTKDIEVGFRLYRALPTIDDRNSGAQWRTLVGLSQTRELIAQEDALLAGALAAGRFTGDEPSRFVQLVGAAHHWRDQTVADLSATDLARYQRLASSAGFRRLTDLEATVVAQGHTGSVPPVDAREWQRATATVIDGLRDIAQRGIGDLRSRVTPVDVWVIVRLVLAGGLGLLGIGASGAFVMTTMRERIQQ